MVALKDESTDVCMYAHCMLLTIYFFIIPTVQSDIYAWHAILFDR